MAAPGQSSETPLPCGLEKTACLTALGDATETLEALLLGRVALAKRPVLGKDGGDEVPLACIGAYDETIPPHWQKSVDALVAQLPKRDWGDPRHPIFLTSSNFDVGSLYAYRKTGDARYLQVGTPTNTLLRFRRRYGWGENALALSHACVTANLGIDLACRRIQDGLADQALVFSFDFVSPFVAGGFHALKILNSHFPAPFEDRSIGSIGLGDGAGFAVLSARQTSARIVSNFLYNEMHHFTANDPEGSGFQEGAKWLREAAKGKSFWIKGHGTGTLDAGRLEAQTLAEAFPDSPLVSWKGSIGHTLGSCGIVELAIAAEAVRRKTAPGCVGVSGHTFAPNVQTTPFATDRFDAAALFSNAFGGAHAACLLSYD